jgi:hypothetical protein
VIFKNLDWRFGFLLVCFHPEEQKKAGFAKEMAVPLDDK